MVTRRISTLLAAATITALGTQGCIEVGGARSASTSYSHFTTAGSSTGAVATAPKAEPKPAPAPKAEAKPAPAPKAEAKPAPAPRVEAAAPAMAAGSNVMYYPTGDRNTSVLMLEKILPAEVSTGQPFDYILKVTNLTKLSLSNVTVDDALPAGFKVDSMSKQGTQVGSGITRWNIGTMAPNASDSIIIKGSAGAQGTLNSCASVAYSSSLCSAINVVQPALKITKTMGASALLCDNIPVEITVTNTGSGAARNVKITDNLPAGLAFTDGKATWDIGTLAAGQSQTVKGTVKASKTGQYANSASATADGGLTANSGNVSTAVKQPVLALTVDCGPALRLGRNATIKFMVRNTGDAPSNNTTLAAAIPAGASFVSADNGGTNGNWNLGTVNPGESKTVSMVLKPNAGTFTVGGTVNGACATAATANCNFGVTGVPDIGTGIQDFDGVRAIGEGHEFTYVVKNQGQTDLTNVKMVAEFDDGLDYVSTNYPGGATVTGKTTTWNIGTLKPGQEISFKIAVKGAKADELVIRTTTTSDQMKPVRNDEQVNYVE